MGPNQPRHGQPSHALAPRAAAPREKSRLRVCATLIAILAVLIFSRALALELTGGATFRALASRPKTKTNLIFAPRGRIVDRHGEPLAADHHSYALAVYYPWMEKPSRPSWLRFWARANLDTKRERDNPALVAASQAKFEKEVADWRVKVARLAGLTIEEFDARAAVIQRQIQQRAKHVDEERRAREAEQAAERLADVEEAENSFWDRLLGYAPAAANSAGAPPRRKIGEVPEIVEQQAYHIIAVDQFYTNPESIEDKIGAIHLVPQSRREYPAGDLAAHIVGYVGLSPEPVHVAKDEVYQPLIVGQSGIELANEQRLIGKLGWITTTISTAPGKTGPFVKQAPVPGKDVTLTLDLPLQRSAETLLDEVNGNEATGKKALAGGAIVVLDCQKGEILAAASAPGFAPAVFTGFDSAAIDSLLNDSRHALMNRPIQMALPPGSVFKIVTALALLEQNVVKPGDRFSCQGYLTEPTHRRCALFEQLGVGHGDVILKSALAESCNVYFFHHAAALDRERFLELARKLGFGEKTGVDLPAEAAGQLPTPELVRERESRDWNDEDTQSLVVGQSLLTATPLQIARLMVAVGAGQLVTPHVVENATTPEPQPLAGISPPALAAVRAGLIAAVDSEEGTAHELAELGPGFVAGKTGTAEAGGSAPPHAWFAGYAPAENPRYAVVIVLEHAGAASETAVPLAHRLLARMRQLDYFAK